MVRLLILLFLLVGVTLPAQTLRGALGVTVRDGSRAIVRDATLTLTDKATGKEWLAKTDANGEFIFGALPPGDYRLVIDSVGFRKHSEGVTLTVNQDARAEILLQPSQGITIDNRQLLNLPLNGRNFAELALLEMKTRTVKRCEVAKPSCEARLHRAAL